MHATALHRPTTVLCMRRWKEQEEQEGQEGQEVKVERQKMEHWEDCVERNMYVPAAGQHEAKSR